MGAGDCSGKRFTPILDCRRQPGPNTPHAGPMMENNLISCLCCPHDQSGLLFNGMASAASEEREANLQCVVCGSGFPIEKGIPRFFNGGKKRALPTAEIGDGDS